MTHVDTFRCLTVACPVLTFQGLLSVPWGTMCPFCHQSAAAVAEPVKVPEEPGKPWDFRKCWCGSAVGFRKDKGFVDCLDNRDHDWRSSAAQLPGRVY